MLGATEQDTGLQTGFHESRGAETSLKLLLMLLLMQTKLAFWSANIHFCLMLISPPTNTTKSFSPGFNPFFSQPGFVLGIALTQVKDFVLDFVGLPVVCTNPPLKVSLGDIHSFQSVNCTTHLGVARKLAEGVVSAQGYKG